MTTLVTLFGGGGFVGRYVTQALLRQGARVRVVSRRPRDAFFLRPQAGLGWLHFAGADITKPATVARAVAGSDAVVNLVGLLSGPMRAVHVDGSRHVAEAAAAAGARALVQVSAIGADAGADTDYARTKGEGEAAARAAFPGATVVRPSIVFGAEDDFLNRFARMIQLLPVVPVIAPATRFQPIWATDLGKAIAAAALDPKRYGGRTFELGGPEVLSMMELNRKIAHLIGRKRSFVELPGGVAAMLAALPGGPLTRDQLKMLGRDNVVSPGAAGLEAFDLGATAIETVAPQWMVKFYRQGRFGAERHAL